MAVQFVKVLFSAHIHNPINVISLAIFNVIAVHLYSVNLYSRQLPDIMDILVAGNGRYTFRMCHPLYSCIYTWDSILIFNRFHNIFQCVTLDKNDISVTQVIPIFLKEY